MLADLQARQEREEMEARMRAEGEGDGGIGERDLDAEVPDAEDVGEDETRDLDDEVPEAEVTYATDLDETNMDETRDLDAEVPEAEERDLDDGVLEAEERDLDDDVPDATEGDITFGTLGDESLLEGSMVENVEEDERAEQERLARLEEEELTGVAREREELGLERDLDDSVPEAGSYEHTDTELEEDTTLDESSIMMNSAPRRQSWRPASRESAGSRRSLRSQGMSSLLGSSILGSSPMLARRGGNMRDNSNR